MLELTSEARGQSRRIFSGEKLVIFSTAFFSLLIIIDFLLNNNQAIWLIPVSLVVILIFFWLPVLRQKISDRSRWFFVLSALPLAGYAYLYKLAGALVHFLGFDWQDELLVKADCWIFGFSPNLKIVRFYHPILTELMMVAYVAYLPLVVLLAYVIFLKKGQESLQKYVFTLGLAYLLCFIFFILFPASSPRFIFTELKPTGGFLFRRLMDLVETSAQYRGGSFPSAHCAAGTVMICYAWRTGRKTFLLITPMILLFFLSTVYGQYHYGVDVLAGVLVGLLAVFLSRLGGRKLFQPNKQDQQ